VSEDEELIQGVIRQEKIWLKRFHEQFENYLYNYISQKVERAEDVRKFFRMFLFQPSILYPLFLANPRSNLG